MTERIRRLLSRVAGVAAARPRLVMVALALVTLLAFQGSAAAVEAGTGSDLLTSDGNSGLVVGP